MKDHTDSKQRELGLDLARTATSSLALVRAYLESGATHDAIKCCKQALSDGSVDRAEAQLLLAEALLISGRFDEVASVLRQIPEDIGAHLRSERTLIQARIIVERGRYVECIERFAFDLSQTVNHKSDVVLGGLLAECHTRIRNLSSARVLFEWTIRESENLGWSEGVANGLMSLALLDRIEGHWSRADGLLLKARESYARLGLSRKYIQATLNLGLQRLWRGHLTFADEALREAVRLSVETADTRLEATARMDRGLALVRLNRLVEARQELAKALYLCRRQASPRRVAIALEYTGEYHLANGDCLRAATALRRALTIANRIAPEGDIVPEVRRRQAEVALAQANVEDALEIARDADYRATKLGDRYERATALRVQGQALRELNRDAEAVKILREALTILEDLGETFERDRIVRLLGGSADDDNTDPLTETHPISHDSPQPIGTAGSVSKKEVHHLLRKYGMIGMSRALVDVMREAVNIAPLQIPVLIQGETGTGKELLARAIHNMSGRPRRPLVAFNCATCPPDLLDAELFGHQRGAFTGAHVNRLGLVRTAEGGTLFLDEIGEMREESQARLLRLLDSGEVRPLGSDRTRRVNVRIVAATHADLEDRIRLKLFRRDLFFRLAGIRLVLPPLRKRPGDLRELIDHFVKEARETIRPGFAGFSEDIVCKMQRYSWPGNIRQLRLEVHRHAALAHEGVPISEWTPSDDEQLAGELKNPAEAAAILKDPAKLRQFALDSGGHVADMARALGVSRAHIYRTLKRLGLSLSDLRKRN